MRVKVTAHGLSRYLARLTLFLDGLGLRARRQAGSSFSPRLWLQALISFRSRHIGLVLPGVRVAERSSRCRWLGRLNLLDPHLMEQGARAAAHSVDRFIDREMEKYGLTPDRVALVGFSQGTMMALHVGLRREQQIGAILGFSGVLVGGRNLKEQMRSKPPVLLIHGDRDPTIPIPAMFDSAEALAAADHGAQWHISYGVPHSIGADGLELGGEFLAMYLKTKGLIGAG
jgi:predicted esterase